MTTTHGKTGINVARGWRWALLLLLCAALSGCLVGSNTQTKITGKDVSESWLRIKPGDSKEYVAALLGEPTEKTSIPGGTEIWKWQYTEQKDSSGYILVIFGTHNSTKIQRTNFVEFKDGVVATTWQEGGSTAVKSSK